MMSSKRLGIALLLLAVLFAGVVWHRSVALRRPQGDFRVYCRAAWAIRMGGEQLYRVTDNNGWHYHYPPLFAILLAPFADAPAGAERLTSIPFPIAILIFYLINLTCLAVAVHGIARLYEASTASGDVEHWWRWRAWPVALCLPVIGLTLVRSQVQLILLALLVGFIVNLVRGRRLRAGLWLAGAICLKIFPAYLLLVPLGRRDGRCLTGCGLGLLIGLGVIPLAVLGPTTTRQVYVDRFEFLANVFTAERAEQPGGAEMLEATAAQSQSFQVVLHKWLHLGDQAIPPIPAPGVRASHWAIAGLFTLTVLLPGSLRQEQGVALAHRLALLTLLMVLICPICHLHYLTLALPLFSSLVVARFAQPRLTVLAVLWLLATSLPMLPGCRWMRDVGVPLAAAIALLGYGWSFAYREMFRFHEKPPAKKLNICDEVACLPT